MVNYLNAQALKENDSGITYFNPAKNEHDHDHHSDDDQYGGAHVVPISGYPSWWSKDYSAAPLPW